VGFVGQRGYRNPIRGRRSARAQGGERIHKRIGTGCIAAGILYGISIAGNLADPSGDLRAKAAGSAGLILIGAVLLARR
jgi:hypothetical protein